MRAATLSLILASLWCAAAIAQTHVATYKKLQLTDKFYCEGAYYADFNRDGNDGRGLRPLLVRRPRLPAAPRSPRTAGIRSQGLLRQLPDLHGRFQRRRLGGHPVRALAGQGRFLVREPGREGGTLDGALRPEERRQRIARVGRRQRRRTARSGLQHRRLSGLRHLGPGQTRRAVDVPSGQHQGRLPAIHARRGHRRHQRRRPRRHRGKRSAGGSSRPTRSRASPGSATTTSSPTPPPRCWSTTSTATG